MPLSPDFQFSQASLQDYVECPRRFELRHLLELAWPAVSAEPAAEFEARLAEGQAFHRLVHQHLLGVPAAPPETPGREMESLGRLAAWWQNYLAAGPRDLPPARRPEITLSAPLAGRRLLAKYDLIAVQPGGRAVIVDWKTSQRRPARPWLVGRMQTRVYRYLLVAAGRALNGGQPIRPEQVEMIYWFAEFPDQPERLAYDATQYAADHKHLADLAAEIAAEVEARERGKTDGFLLTTDMKQCRFCAYRSLCERGGEAGDMDQADDGADAIETAAPSAGETFDFEQVAEIAF